MKGLTKKGFFKLRILNNGSHRDLAREKRILFGSIGLPLPLTESKIFL